MVKFNKPRSSGGARKKRREITHEFKPEMMYIDGVVAETLVGTRFKVKVERDNLDPYFIECGLKTIFKAKKIIVIRGQEVTVEVDPALDLSKGTIVLIKRRENTQQPSK